MTKTTRFRLVLAAGWVLALVPSAAGQVTPRAGWSLVAGAQDLIQAGAWGCVAGVTAAPGLVTVSAGSVGYNTVIDTTGPVLRVNGDFSVLARLSAPNSPGTFLTLVGALSNGAWWQGLKRLDVGFTGSAIQTNYWTGSSSASTFMSLGALPAGDPVTFEVARIGAQLVIYVNGTQAGSFADPGIFASGTVYLGFNVAPGGTLVVSGLAAAVPSGALASASFFAPWLQTIPRSGSGLRDLAGKGGFLVGAAVVPSLFSQSPYSQDLGREFNLVVAANAMKFAETEPGPGQYNFCAADEVVAFAQANGMKVRGHNLVWQQDLPSWLTTGNYSAADAANILQDHIRTVVSHFKGQLILWDVVNEAVAYGAPYGPQPSYWLDQFGSLTSYVDQAFRWAHAADPSVKLYYNDTGGEGLGAKSDAVYNLVSGMVSRGVPIDGIGLQMHVTLNSAPSPADVAANMACYAQLGLEVQITEMDVRLAVPASASDLQAQSSVYNGVAATCMAAPNCTAFLTWGVGDPDSWIPGAYPGFGAALLFDGQYQPTPAYDGVASAITAAVAKPRIFYGGIVIHAGVSTTVSPGSLADIYGSNLAAAAASLPAGAAKLPATLGGTQVSVDGVAAPLVYVSGSQVIFQAPYETAPGTATVVVTSGGVASGSAPLTVRAAAPSILTYGGNRAVVVNQDGAINSATACAAPGSTVVTYLIGSGPVDNPIATGALAPLSPFSQETLPVSVTLDRTAAPSVPFAGMAPGFAGLVQLNFVVPAVAAGDHALIVSFGSAQSNQPLMCVSQQAPSASRQIL